MLREKSGEFELLALFLGEPGAFVKVGFVEESRTGQRAVLGTAGAEGEMTEMRMFLVGFGSLVMGGHFEG